MYDLKDWFLMPSIKAGFNKPDGTPYGRETHHTEGVNLKGDKVYAYHSDTGKTMIFTKGPKAWPMDTKPYDQNFIYDGTTENGWASPSDFKQMSMPLAMCPRFWNGDESQYQFHPNMPYDVFTNCAKTGKGDVGPGLFTLKGPFMMDFMGDVRTAQCILLTYYWSDKKNREQLFLTPSVGWCIWTHGVLTQLSPNTADYVNDSVSTHNKIVAGQVKPNFPCFVIP